MIMFRIHWIYWSCLGYTGYIDHVQDTLDILIMFRIHWIYWSCSGYTGYIDHVQQTLDILIMFRIHWIYWSCSGYTGWAWISPGEKKTRSWRTCGENRIVKRYFRLHIHRQGDKRRKRTNPIKPFNTLIQFFITFICRLNNIIIGNTVLLKNWTAL